MLSFCSFWLWMQRTLPYWIDRCQLKAFRHVYCLHNCIDIYRNASRFHSFHNKSRLTAQVPNFEAQHARLTVYFILKSWNPDWMMYIWISCRRVQRQQQAVEHNEVFYNGHPDDPLASCWFVRATSFLLVSGLAISLLSASVLTLQDTDLSETVRKLNFVLDFQGF